MGPLGGVLIPMSCKILYHKHKALNSLSLLRTQLPVSRKARSPNRANSEILHGLCTSYTHVESPRKTIAAKLQDKPASHLLRSTSAPDPTKLAHDHANVGFSRLAVLAYVFPFGPGHLPGRPEAAVPYRVQQLYRERKWMKHWRKARLGSKLT